MNQIVRLSIAQFSLIYLLLLVVLLIMQRTGIKQQKLLLIASIKMTVQLVLAGFILTYLFENPHPALTLGYLAAMIGFTIYRVLSQNKSLPPAFLRITAGSIVFAGLFVLCFFVLLVVRQSLFAPQYVIPLSGMLMGNTMTGTSLGLKAFRERLSGQRERMQALLCLGAHPRKILMPFVQQSLETALLPTLNSMLGMGIVSLPGMMTGQILSGTPPLTAILYQIAIMIAICTVSCTACFGALYFGQSTLYDHKSLMLHGDISAF